MKNIIINNNLFNNKELSGCDNLSILQFCEYNNIENIPRFCYHESLSIAGNCRMCLVEDAKSIKPVVACTVLINDNMTIYTNTIKVKKARESVLEFLLINHPLDCPICCQGGECDLQDITEIFGADSGRYYETKRAVLNKNLGPIIKTVMNRCIHCTRCVRFAVEIGGISTLGVLGRGGSMEIGTYIDRFINSEFSGNIIDLCPVGALTSKPYSYIARPWELEITTIRNILEPTLPLIRVDIRGNKILRVLPYRNTRYATDFVYYEGCDYFYSEFLSYQELGEWISDKTRFFIDSLYKQRLCTPLLILGKSLVISYSWKEIFDIIRYYFINTLFWLLKNRFKYMFFINYNIETCDIISLIYLKWLQHGLGFSINIQGLNKEAFYNWYSCLYALDGDIFTDLVTITRYYDVALLIIGGNLRLNYPALYLRFLEITTAKKHDFKIYNWGLRPAFSYPIQNLGSNLKTLINIYEGKHWICSDIASHKEGFSKKKWRFLVLDKKFYSPWMDAKLKYNISLNVWCRLIPSTSGSVLQKYIGFVNGIHSQNFEYFNSSGICYNLGSDNNFISYLNSKKNLIIYQGYIGDIGAKHANIILPTVSYIESVPNKKDNNTLYYMQANRAIFFVDPVITGPKGTRSSNDILIALINYLNIEVNAIQKFYKSFFILKREDRWRYFFEKTELRIGGYPSTIQLLRSLHTPRPYRLKVFFWNTYFSLFNTFTELYTCEHILVKNSYILKLTSKVLNNEKNIWTELY